MSEVAKPFKIWNYDRTLKKSITASSLQELIEKGCQKLTLDQASDLRIVLEEDGTEVDDEDYFTFLPVNSTLLFLVNDEQWKSSAKDKATWDETDHSVVSCHKEETALTLLAQQLSQDLSNIMTFSSEQLQQLVDWNSSHLAQMLGESERYACSIQTACQRHLDEHAQTMEALELLKLYHSAQQFNNPSQESKEKKRKMEESL